MFNAKARLRWLAPLAITLAAGCGPGYYRYPDCDVDCQYFVPPPLPYIHYEGCVCHSCAASKYLSYQPQREGGGAETEAGEPIE